MENVEVAEKIKNSDDGKGILITNDAIEQISNLLKNQTIKIESGRSNNACRQNMSQNGWIWTTFSSKLQKKHVFDNYNF